MVTNNEGGNFGRDRTGYEKGTTMVGRYFNRILFCLAVLLCQSNSYAGPDSIAHLAKATASSELSSELDAGMVNDRVIGIEDKGEWVCKGSTVFWGYIKYPWIQLDWDEPQSIEKVLLYDRVTLKEHTAGGTLEFSDGSEISVLAIPNDGSPKVISFPAKKVTWIRFVVTDGMGKDLGLSEIEVFPSPEMYRDYVSWVDPFIETTRGRYLFFATGSCPFGMISAAANTRNKNQWGGGYNYNSTEVLGFDQIHAWMLSGVQIMPTTGEVNPTLGAQGWKSKFSHDDEIAQPGYHRIFLQKYKIWVEQTCTDRVSFYRFKYTKDDEANILINMSGFLGNSTMTNPVVNKVSDSELEGHFISQGRLWGGPDKIKIFFSIMFDTPFKALNGWDDKTQTTNIVSHKGVSEMITANKKKGWSYYDAPTSGVAAQYEVKAGDAIQMKIAISYTSVENARNNLVSECDHWDFDKVRRDARSKWNQYFEKMEVKGGTREQKVKFYTDLWHVLLGRHKLNDISGDYPDYTQRGDQKGPHYDADLKVRTLPRDKAGNVKYNMYNSDAFWLTQWNLNVLWGLAWPEVLDDISASLIQYADNGELLPRGPCAGGYSFIMTGCPATSLIVSTYMKNLMKKSDPEHAFDVMKQNHLPGGMMGLTDFFQGGTMGSIDFYTENGWCPNNAGKTLEWCSQDWALAQMAGKLDKKEDKDFFLKRSAGWKSCYNPEQKLIFPKTEKGEWLHDDPLSGKGWVEANAWQGTWSVSHDIRGLAKLMGGTEILCKKLNYAFEKAESTDFVFAYSGGYVSYANQPGCSNAHVFNHAGKPWLSQYWVRKVNKQAYGGTTPDLGYGGHDEDQGQMGGISVLMSIGLFSLRGNTSSEPIYEITAPVFDEVIIKLDPKYYSGKQFVIKTYNNSEKNCYIQKAKLNGKALNNYWFLHSNYEKGGSLEIWLGPEPNKNWGVADLPPS